MGKLLIVAGEHSNELARFMNERGTFQVDDYFESFSRDINKIKLSIIKVEKTLYLYQPSTANTINSIRSDMQALSDLFKNNNFFNPGEITFMISKSDDNARRAIQYFQSVMESVHYTDYKIKVLDDVMTFANIYDKLLGISQSQNFDNKKVNRYRVERGNNAKTAYVPKLDPNLRIEPFDYHALSDYDNAKRNAVRVESGLEYVDEDKEFEKFDNPEFGRFGQFSSLDTKKLYVISGLPKSGCTTMTIALASSLMKDDKSVLIIDYSDNTDVTITMELSNVQYNKYNMSDLIRRHTVQPATINVCQINNEKEDSVKFEFLKNFFSKNTDFDSILLLVPHRFLEYVHSILHSDVARYFICTTMLNKDIGYVTDVMMPIMDTPITVVISNRTVVLNPAIKLSIDEIRASLPKTVTVCAPLNFEDLHVGANLSRKLLGYKHE